MWAKDYPLARVDVNVEPLYSASVTRREDSLPRCKSSKVGGGGGGGRLGAVGGIREDRGWQKWSEVEGKIEDAARGKRTSRTNGRC